MSKISKYHDDFTGEANTDLRPYRSRVGLKRNKSRLAGPVKVLRPDKDGNIVEVDEIPIENVINLPSVVTYRYSLLNLIDKAEDGKITLVSHDIRILYHLHNMNFLEALRSGCLPMIEKGIKWRDKDGILRTKYLFNGCKPWNQYDDLK